MRRGWIDSLVGVVMLFAFLTVLPVFAPPAEAEDKPAAKKEDSQKGSTRIKDAPEPIPQVMDKLKEVGNEVGKAISKATSEGAKAVKKAVNSNKEKEEK